MFCERLSSLARTKKLVRLLLRRKATIAAGLNMFWQRWNDGISCIGAFAGCVYAIRSVFGKCEFALIDCMVNIFKHDKNMCSLLFCFFFYKSTLYNNSEAQICTILRIF